ncbi:MAG: hypothetical protein ABIH68_02850 [bacterium]
MGSHILFIFNLLFSVLPQTEASFNQPFSNAREAALAGGNVAMDGDALSIFSNPARVPGVKRIEAGAGYNTLLSSLDDSLKQNIFAFNIPVKYGILGAGSNVLSLSDIYSESTYILSLKRAFWGINLKLLGHEYSYKDKYTAADPVLQSGTSKNAFTVDGGVLLKFDSVKVGICCQNLLPADVGLKEKDAVPLVFKSGIALNKKGFLRLYDSTFHLEIDYRNASYLKSSDRLNYILSMEAWPFFHNFGLRGGISPDFFSAGFCIQNVFGNFTKAVQIDYAYTFPINMGGGFSSHYFSFLCRFGRTLGDDEIKKILSDREALKLKKQQKEKEKEDAEKLERKRTAEIRNLLRDARKLIRSKDYEKAAETITEVFTIDPKNRQAGALLRDIEKNKEIDMKKETPVSEEELQAKKEAELERKRTEEIRNLIRDARKYIRSKDYVKSTQTIAEIFNIAPENKIAKSLLTEIDNRKKADIRAQEQRLKREKEAEIRLLKRKIQQKLDRQSYEEAIKLAEEALQIDPEDKSVKKLLKQAQKKMTDDK